MTTFYFNTIMIILSLILWISGCSQHDEVLPPANIDTNTPRLIEPGQMIPINAAVRITD